MTRSALSFQTLAGDATSALQPVTLQQLQAAIQGFAPKDSVRVATTANVTISTALNSGDSIDGVTLANGDRVLVKDQSAPAENGIYVVSASPARATDVDTAAEAASAQTLVEEGTANKDTFWYTTFNASDTLGTTAMTWVQFASVNDLIAGAGLTKSGNTINVGDGSGITVNADDIAVNVGSGLEISSDAVRIAAAAAGAGLTGGGGSALAVGAGTDMTVNADDITPSANIPRKASAETITAAWTVDVNLGTPAFNIDNDNAAGELIKFLDGGVDLGKIGNNAAVGLTLTSRNGGLYLQADNSGDVILSPIGTGNVDASSKRIKNVAAPSSANDAARVAYNDAKYPIQVVDTTFGNSASQTITHNLGSKNHITQAFITSTGAEVDVEVLHGTASDTVNLDVLPGASTVTVVVIGIDTSPTV